MPPRSFFSSSLSQVFQNRRTRWVLITVAILELGLFVQQRLADGKTLRAMGTTQTLAGEGWIIRADGLGYYAWLRSLLIDRDWSFANEFR